MRIEVDLKNSNYKVITNEGTKCGFCNKNLNPNNYFSDAMLEGYKNYISVTEEINTMHFKNFIQVNDFEYYGNITYEDVYKYMNNNNKAFSLIELSIVLIIIK